MPGVQAYDWQVFSEDKEGLLPFGAGEFYRYSDLLSVVVLLCDCVFFIVLTWYFDILVASNRGRGESVFFPIKWLYKFIVR